MKYLVIQHSRTSQPIASIFAETGVILPASDARPNQVLPFAAPADKSGDIPTFVAQADAGLLRFEATMDAPLPHLARLAASRILEWLRGDDRADSLFALFGGDRAEPDAGWLKAAADLRRSILDGEYGLPVQLLSHETLSGAFGAFAAQGPDGTPVVFLNRDWIAAGASADAIVRVLIEEFGHSLDAYLNGVVDTPGDEGEAFAAAVLTLYLPAIERQRIAAENDHAVIYVDGVAIEVEQAALTFPTAYTGTPSAWSEEANSLNGLAALAGSNFKFTSSDPSAPYFSGNNVTGTLSYTDGGGNPQTLTGVISRLFKTGSTVEGFYFYTFGQDGIIGTHDAGEGAYALVRFGYTGSFSAGTNEGTSSDPVDTALNSTLAANSAPVANNDSATINEDGVATGNVRSNDTDANLDTLTVTQFTVGGTTYPVSSNTPGSATITGVGSLTMTGAGAYTFTPLADYAGPVPVVAYTISDGKGGTATANLSISITPVNDAPTSSDYTKTGVTASTKTPLAKTDFGSYNDIEGDAFAAVKIAQLPSAGTLEHYDSLSGTWSQINGAPRTVSVADIDAGKLRYTGPAGSNTLKFQVYDGHDYSAAEYTLTITANANANQNPLANPDTNAVTTDIATSITGNVLTNDTDPDGSDSALVVAEASKGSTLSGTIYSMTPPAPFDANAESVTYTTFAVTFPSNNKPQTGESLTLSGAGIPAGTTGTVTMNVNTGTIVLDNGVGLALTTSSSLTIGGSSNMGKGSETLTPSSVTVVAASYIGVTNAASALAVGMTVTGTGIQSNTAIASVFDAGTYRLVGLNKAYTGGTVATDLKFTAASSGQTIPGDRGNLALNQDGSYTYTATLPYTDGTADTFSYKVADSNGGTATTTLTVNVKVPNSAPTNTVPGAQTVDYQGQISIPSLSVGDIDNNLSKVELSVSHGTLSATASGSGLAGSGTAAMTLTGTAAQIAAMLGTVTYAPTAGYSGSDVVTMKSTDTISATDTDTVNVTVNPAPTVTGTTVNELSSHVYFDVSGAIGQKTTLAVASGTATLGSDATSNLEYYDGATWRAYDGGAVAIPDLNGTGKLFVRVAVLTDTLNEGGETLRLTATTPANVAQNGDATIVDDGTGAVYSGVVTGTSLNTMGGTLDDDRPLSVNDVTVNEASPFAVFEVSGAVGQTVASLTLTDGLATSGADFGPGLQYLNTTTNQWTAYAPNLPIPAGGKLLVRTPALNDGALGAGVYEGAENFGLVAANAGGRGFTGTGVVIDDGTGAYYPDNLTGAPDPAATLDRDSAVKVSAGTPVNEASAYAMFEVTGAAGTPLMLSLDDGTTALSGAKIQYSYDGSTNWTDYDYNESTKTGTPPTPTGGGNVTFYVRVAIAGEQDNPAVYEGPETFRLIATTIAAGTTLTQSASATATIVDDGTGTIYGPNANQTGTSGLDQDLPAASIAVSSTSMAEDAAGTLTYTVTLSNASAFDTTVGYSISGTATGGGVDYTTTGTGTLTIVKGQTSGSFTIDPTADATVEPDETVVATLTAAGTNGKSLTLQTSVATGTIANDDNGPVTVTIADNNGAAAGQETVAENATLSGKNFTVAAGGGLAKLKIGSTEILAADLANAGTKSIPATTGKGTLTVVGYDGGTGKVTYDYAPTGTSQNHSGGDGSVTDAITIVATDKAAQTGNGTLTLMIADTAPTAKADTAGVTEDASPNTATGNVVTTGAGADTLGGDATVVAGVASGDTKADLDSAGTVASDVKGTYGKLKVAADGAYTYTLDNGNAAVQALNAGQTLTDTFTYTIKDGDGDMSHATLTVTVDGANESVPALTIADNNGADTGQETVTENATLSGKTFAVAAAGGLAKLKIGSTEILAADLANAGTKSIPVTVGKGTLTVVGYDGGTGKVTYDYAPTGTSQNHSGGDASVTDAITIVATDKAGQTGNGTLTLLVGDTAPTAGNDTAGVTEDASPNAATGNVATNDAKGADLPINVVGVAKNATGTDLNDSANTVGKDVTGAYGKLNVATDGSYTYTLDNGNAAVQALNAGQTLTDTFTYTIKDGDGDMSHATLTVTVDGADENAPPPSTPPAPPPETERDGVPAATETSLAQQIVGTGDLNGDGKNDAQQDSVATLAWISNANFQNAIDGKIDAVPKPSIIALIVDAPQGGTETGSALQDIAVLASDSFGGGKPVGVEAPWDPIRFTVVPAWTPTGGRASEQLPDFDALQPGVQTRVTIDISRAGLPEGYFNAYEKYVSAESIRAYGALGRPLLDLDGQPIVQPGWHDFTQRTPGGDGARYVIENGKIVAIEIVFTDGAFGDSDPGAGTIVDPGIPVLVPTPTATPAPTVSGPTVNEASPYAVFAVTGVAGQSIALNLIPGTAAGNGIDYGSTGANALQYSPDGGATWLDYGGPIVMTGATALARTPIVDDGAFEGSETFALTASHVAGGASATGTATILDDGTGAVFDADGRENLAAAKDDDRPLTVGSPVVNENSPYAVFEIRGASGQTLALSLNAGTALDGGVDFGPGLQYSLDGGASWTDYAGPFVLIGATALARTRIVDDVRFEGRETFGLTATPASGVAAVGTATLYDDGTGAVFDGNGNENRSAVKDDDRPLAVSAPTVKENAPYAVFEVRGATGQTVALNLSAGTATGGGIDFGPGLHYSSDGGATWRDYAGSIVLSGTSVLARTPLADDTLLESGETFDLTATATGGTEASGTAIVVDDDAAPTPGAPVANVTEPPAAPSGTPVGGGKSQPLAVDSPAVNENSPYAVFSVSGAADQAISLNLSAGGASGGGVDFGSSDAHNLQYSLDGGASWHDYLGAFVLGGSSALVRTPIIDDAPFEERETFVLTATAPGATPASGTAAILDNGEGALFDEAGGIDVSSVKDDDRVPVYIPPLTVGSPTVNENSPYAVFTIAGGAIGQPLELSPLDGSATGGGIDYGTNDARTLQYSLDNGASWRDYAGAFALTGAAVRVRTPLTDDNLFDNGETFRLTATSSASTAAGTATIRDDGTGAIFNADGSENFVAAKDDDRALTVDSPAVNEKSSYAVFALTGATGQTIALSLNAGTASGDGVDFGPALQYSLDGGANWLEYAGAFALSGGAALARTPVTDDGRHEGAETFGLTASVAGGASAVGTATIRDDGTGTIFGANGGENLAAAKDDDRPVTVDSPVVNENSPYAVFALTGAAGQTIALSLNAGTATGDGVDFGPGLQYSLDGGANWRDYAGAFALNGPAALARTPVADDGRHEGAETFGLTASVAGGASAAGTATIRDDGTGAIFNADGGENLAAAKDDDRPVTVDSPVVNENSPYAVFALTGAAGQTIALSLNAGTATGDGVDFGPGLQYSLDGGANWIEYAGAFVLNDAAALARTPLVNDGRYEGAETFGLTASVAGGASAVGTATIRDDGTGALFDADGRETLASAKDDDRSRGHVQVGDIEGDAAKIVDFPDTLIGSDEQDVLFGLRRKDVLQGLAGDDRLVGGFGRDTLQGGDGDDRLDGGKGWDRLSGGTGDDTLIGGKGRDYYLYDGFAPGERDIVDDNRGYIDLSVELENRFKLAGATLSALTGRVAVGSAFDRANGVAFQDGELRFDLNGDGAYAPEDDFAVALDAQNVGSVVYLARQDLFLFKGAIAVNPGAATTTDTSDVYGPGIVRVGDLEDNALVPEQRLDRWTGTEFADALYGLRRGDALDGMAGDDYLSGGRGRDTLTGGDGADTLKGGRGADSLQGGAGDDTLAGGLGRDTYIYAEPAAGERDTIRDNRGFIDLRAIDGGTLKIHGQALADLAGNVVLGATIDADNGLAFDDGELRIDINGDGAFDPARDAAVELIGGAGMSIGQVAYKALPDLLWFVAVPDGGL